jgi:hypothetical protein
MYPVGFGATVRDYIVAEFTLGRFNPGIDFSCGYIPGQGVGDRGADRSMDIRQCLDYLAYDTDALHQFMASYQGTGPGVAALFGGDLEVELIVDQIGVVTAYIEGEAGGA